MRIHLLVSGSLFSSFVFFILGDRKSIRRNLGFSFLNPYLLLCVAEFLGQCPCPVPLQLGYEAAADTAIIVGSKYARMISLLCTLHVHCLMALVGVLI